MVRTTKQPANQRRSFRKLMKRSTCTRAYVSRALLETEARVLYLGRVPWQHKSEGPTYQGMRKGTTAARE